MGGMQEKCERQSYFQEISYNLQNARTPESDPGSTIPLSKATGISLKSGLAKTASPIPIHKYDRGNVAFFADGYIPGPIICRNSRSALSLANPSVLFNV